MAATEMVLPREISQVITDRTDSDNVIAGSHEPNVHRWVPLTVGSSSEKVLQTWERQVNRANDIIDSVLRAKESAKPGQRININVSLEDLRDAASRIQNAYDIAVKKVAIEDDCCWCSHRVFLTYTATGMDLAVRGATIYLFQSNANSVATLVAAGGSTALSVVKEWVWSKEKELTTLIGRLQQIVSDKLTLDRIYVEIQNFEDYQRFGSTERLEAMQRRKSISQEAAEASPSVIVPEPVIDAEKLRATHVKATCGVPRLNVGAVIKLEKDFDRIQEEIDTLVFIMWRAMKKDAAADLSIQIGQLEDKLVKLKTIFRMVTELDIAHEEIKESRSFCIGAKFRTALQVGIQMGAIASSVTDLISDKVNGDDGSRARSAGIAISAFNMGVSLLSTGVSKLQAGDAEAYQIVIKIDGQKGLSKAVTDLIKIFRGRQEFLSNTHLTQDEINHILRKKVPRHFREVLGGKDAVRDNIGQLILERAPQVASPDTALGRLIKRLHAGVTVMGGESHAPITSSGDTVVVEVRDPVSSARGTRRRERFIACEDSSCSEDEEELQLNLPERAQGRKAAVSGEEERTLTPGRSPYVSFDENDAFPPEGFKFQKSKK